MLRINLIGNADRRSGIGNDMEVFIRSFQITRSQHKKRAEFKIIDFRDYKCDLADINIFFENLNPLFIPYGKRNIFIPNQEFFYRIWEPYLKDIDVVWCKTKYAVNCFSSIHPNVKYVGWTTFINPDYWDIAKGEKIRRCILVAGRSKNKNADFVISHWDSKWPELHVFYQKDRLNLNIVNQENIIYHDTYVEPKELYDFQYHSWFHICLSSMEGFGHYINEAREKGSYVITLKGEPMNEFNTPSQVKSRKKRLKETLGVKYNPIEEDWYDEMNRVFSYDTNTLLQFGNSAKTLFQSDRKQFESNFGKIMRSEISKYWNITPPPIYETTKPMSMEECEKVSVITITKNRKVLFPLAIHNINKMNYPLSRIEWVIIEDGDDNVNDLVSQYCNLSPSQIKYERFEGNIGQKRNRGVELASSRYIMMMDDDDYYRPNYIQHQMRMMKTLPDKQCHACTTMGIFHINKLYSMINTPPMNIKPEQRISEATLFFTKTFWETQKFPETQIAEGEGFLSGRMDKVLEMNWEHLFVSFLHEKSTSTRDTYEGEPNGCHYGFDDGFFTFITNLGSLLTNKRLKQEGNNANE